MTTLVLAAALAAPAAPHAVVQPVGPADARWTTGFWADRFETCRTATVPVMGDLMAGTERSQFLHNFRIAAGLAEGRHRGAPWNDGNFYKWLEAAAAVCAVAVAKAQRADGYLHTPVLIANRNGDVEAKPFADRLNFEMYNLGHRFTAACVHHTATGKRTLLDVAVKAADFLCGPSSRRAPSSPGTTCARRTPWAPSTCTVTRVTASTSPSP